MSWTSLWTLTAAGATTTHNNISHTSMREVWRRVEKENEVGIFSILFPRWFETCGVVDQDSQELGPLLHEDSSSGETLKDTPLLFCPLLSSYFFHSRYGTVSVSISCEPNSFCVLRSERRHSISWKRPSGRDEEEITVSQFICRKTQAIIVSSFSLSRDGEEERLHGQKREGRWLFINTKSNSLPFLFVQSSLQFVWKHNTIWDEKEQHVCFPSPSVSWYVCLALTFLTHWNCKSQQQHRNRKRFWKSILEKST